MLVLIMMAVPFTFTATALACDGDVSFRVDLGGGVQIMAASTTLLAQMKAKLQTLYDRSLDNGILSEHMGYLFALKGIKFAIDKTPYGTQTGQADCSTLTYTALSRAYYQKGLSSYYIFGSSKKTSREQYRICKQQGLIFTSKSQLKTGDLIFWRKPNTENVNHVGIYLNHEGSDYIIETTGTAGHAYVSDGLWSNDNYEMFAYARINKSFYATFKTGDPFNEFLAKKQFLYKCPPVPPTLPTHTGYSFSSWSPSITAGMTA